MLLIPQVLLCGARSTRGTGMQWMSDPSGIWWEISPLPCAHTAICVWDFTIPCSSGLILCSGLMLTTTSTPPCSLKQRLCLNCMKLSTSTNQNCCGLMGTETHPIIIGTAPGSSLGFIMKGKARCESLSSTCLKSMRSLIMACFAFTKSSRNCSKRKQELSKVKVSVPQCNPAVTLVCVFSPVRDTVVTNDRWGYGSICKHGGYYTCSDRYNPGHLVKHKWENCLSIDKRSWGYRREAKLSDYLTTEELIQVSLCLHSRSFTHTGMQNNMQTVVPFLNRQ